MGFHRSKGCQHVGLRVGILIVQHLPNFDLIPVHLMLVIYLTVCSLEAALDSFRIRLIFSPALRWHIPVPASPCRTYALFLRNGLPHHSPAITSMDILNLREWRRWRQRRRCHEDFKILRWRPHWESSSTWRMVRNCTC